MNKISLYYSILALIIVVQFVSSVVNKSIAVQASASLASGQQQLEVLEERESELVKLLAEQTSLIAPSDPSLYEAIDRTVALTPTSFLATR